MRFVHSQVRLLLAKSDDWDYTAWGTLLSAANLGFAISIFSQSLLHYAKDLGAAFTEEEKASVLAIWRYAGYLMGILESILYKDGPRRTPSTASATYANPLRMAIPRPW